MNADDKSIHQAIIAREVIDLYRDSHDKRDTAESLDVLCFAMARLTDSDRVTRQLIGMTWRVILMV